MNRLNLDDPKLTAFALGELEGQEAIEMAQQIENDPAAQKYVDDIRETSNAVTLELAKEDASARLPLESREKILGGKKPWYKRALIWAPALTAAAVVALIVSNPDILKQKMSSLEGGMVEIGRDDVAVAPPAKPAAPTQTIAANEPALSDAAMLEEESAPEGAVAQTAGRSAGDVAGMSNAAPKTYALKKGAPLSAFGGRGFIGQAQSIGTAEQFNTERYSHISENGFKAAKDEALSTFSIDVDTASYANVRRYLNGETLPPKDAVRLEEMLNYFKYDYPQPTDGKPFSVTTEVSQAPWNTKHQLVRIGLKGKEIPDDKRPASNIVFLIDTSGSMMEPNKLPLVQKSMRLLVDKMRSQDRVAIVAYAGGDQLVIDSTAGSEKKKILEAIDSLSAGGGTNGAAGINSAYKIAQSHFIKGGVNRVILSTDGDFNVGTTSESELLDLAAEKAKTGVFLTVLGFGTGNYNDSMMVKLADKGNGNHAYIDTLREAQKVLVEQAGGTLQTIAKDVKIQVEFNPKFVSQYRLIGYEKRMLAKEDFNDDTKDAGEIGAGHTVTALYELVPVGVNDVKAGSVDALKYQGQTAESAKLEEGARSATSGELMTVKLRYKKPDGKTSEKFDVPVQNSTKTFDQASSDLKFASAVAGFGMLLRDSDNKGDITYDKVVDIALSNAKVAGKVDDNRIEFMGLVRKAKDFSAGKKKQTDPNAFGGGTKNRGSETFEE